MPPNVDFENCHEVAEFVLARFSGLYPGAGQALLRRLFGDIDAMFAGRHPDYAGNDLRYHNLRHTLMAAACMAELLEGMALADGDVRLSNRDFELAIAAVLLHDSGYLKLKGDAVGTGAPPLPPCTAPPLPSPAARASRKATCSSWPHSEAGPRP